MQGTETTEKQDWGTIRRTDQDVPAFHGLMGNSGPMRRLFGGIRQVGRSEAALLIEGESGVGKELVARAIHAESPRAAGPFIAVNCAGVPGELLESEFFGHRAGAFTGARHARRGLFVAADGGTLLLDEIGEMPMLLQAKLLRTLQEGRIKPVGADREQAVDVRILASTHRDLAAMVHSGDFREDLFYRLEALHLRVPPLRDRADDIERLAHHFMHAAAQRQGKPSLKMDACTCQVLREYSFPGNVRELANALERAVTFCDGDRVLPSDLPSRMHTPETGSNALHQAVSTGTDVERMPTLEQVQRRYARQVLERVGGNKRQAARILGINRRTLYRWLE